MKGSFASFAVAGRTGRSGSTMGRLRSLIEFAGGGQRNWGIARREPYVVKENVEHVHTPAII
jgi:hypothetical protein